MLSWKWIRGESFYCCFYYYLWSHCPRILLHLPRLDPPVIWPASTWSPAQWLLPCSLHLICSVLLPTCLVFSCVTCYYTPWIPALPTTSGSPPSHILMAPSEAGDRPDFDKAPHAFTGSLPHVAFALEWLHATSICSPFMPLSCPRNSGTK